MPKQPTSDRPTESWGVVKVSEIKPSPTNPRKHFDPAKLQELADSIASKGILEPPVVRPRGKKAEPRFEAGKWLDVDHWELVVGERRWRAAKLAGLTSISVIVRDLADGDVLELQAIENEQRADVTPLEQAAHYQRMIESGKSIEQIAKAIGRSVSTVRCTLLLNRLPAKLAAAVESGAVPRSTAELVCRVPGEVEREKVAWCVEHGVDQASRFADLNTAREPMNWQCKGEPLTYRETKELIRECVFVELKSATFSRKALDLVQAAGSCDDCPKRAGNDPELVADGVRADVCTDPACFRAKTDAHTVRVLEEAESSGIKVLTGKESDGLWAHDNGLSYSAPYVDLGEPCDWDDKRRPYSKLLGKACAAAVVVAIDPAGRTHKLVPRDVAAKVLKDTHGITIGYSSGNTSGPKSPERKAEEAKRREENKVARERDNDAMRAVNARATTLMLMPGAAVDLGYLLTNLIDDAASRIWGDEMEAMCKRHGLDAKGREDGGKAIVRHAATLANDERFGLLVECVMVRRKHDAKLLKQFGVDLKQLEKAARDRLKTEKAGKAAPAAKPEKDPSARTAPSVAHNTSGVAGDPAESGEGLLDGFDRSTWRGCPIEDLDLTLSIHEYLKNQSVTTIGELSDRLDSLAGIKSREREAIRDLIDDARIEEE